MSEVRQTIEINIYDFFFKEEERESYACFAMFQCEISKIKIFETDMNSELSVNFAF